MISKFRLDLQAVFYIELVRTTINYFLTKYHAVSSSDSLVSVKNDIPQCTEFVACFSRICHRA